MELKVVEENGVKKLDMTVAQGNVDKYSTEKRGLESALERTNLELGNAEHILEVMKNLSQCWYTPNKSGKLFFLTRVGEPALPAEIAGRVVFGAIPEGYIAIPLRDVKMVKCPGCTEMRELIGCYIESRPNNPDFFVICGNSIHEVWYP